jgi:hypothetical protein
MATNSKFIADIGLKTDNDLQIGGNTTIDGNATVSGNLTVNGTSTTINATTTSVEDNMLELANQNTSSDTLDIGIYGNYDDGLSDGGATEYTGLFRDASDSTWKLFDGLEVAPTTTVDTSGTGYTLADLTVGDLTATTLTATNGLTGSSITYPTSDGTNGQVIKTDGSGNLSFGTVGGTTGIDDNATSTALTIDSSGNLLVGNTDSSPYDRTSGNAIALGDGLISSAQEGGNAAIFNRMTSDGSIVNFRKDGTSVGSIGSISSDLFIAESNVGWRFDGENNQVLPCSTTASTDGTMSIGGAGARVGRIFSSSGINIGGTGAANHLDDYEEGTYQPSVTCSSSGTVTLNTDVDDLNYIKIGRMVHVQGMLTVSSSSAPNGYFNVSLPFNISSWGGTYAGKRYRYNLVKWRYV